MSGSLENRSSLRKLDFPACSQEALSRLLSSFSVGMASAKGTPSSSSSAGQLLSPKETELVLEIIDEFVFFTKPSLSKSKRLNAVQELQLMQVIVDFFQARWSNVSNDPTSDSYFANSDTMVLCNIFNYLFMDPPNSGNCKDDDDDDDCKSTNRMRSLIKLTSIALALKSRPVLHCLGAWLHRHGPASARGVHLCERVLREFVLLVQHPLDAMKSVPVIGALFSAHFATCMTEIYPLLDGGGNVVVFPPKAVIDVVTCWMGESSGSDSHVDDRLLPTLAPVLHSASCLTSQAQPPATPLVGLAKWAILRPLLHPAGGDNDSKSYAKLHVAVLECLAEVKQQRHLVRHDVVPIKKVVALIGSVQEAVADASSSSSPPAAVQECLDRLGQFLNCLAATKCVQGKWDAALNSVKQLPRNHLLNILVQNA